MHHIVHVEIVVTYEPVLIQYIHCTYSYAAIKDQIYIMEFIIICVGLCLILCFGQHFLIFVNSRYKKFYIISYRHHFYHDIIHIHLYRASLLPSSTSYGLVKSFACLSPSNLRNFFSFGHWFNIF